MAGTACIIKEHILCPVAVLQVSASADRGPGFSECLFGPAVIAKKLDGEGFQRLKFKMTLCIGSMGYVRCRKGV